MSVAKHAIDQKEYLKKYLSGDKNKKKKKKDKKQKHETKLKIIDDNVFASGDIKIDEELLLTGEEAPQIVGEIFDDQPAAPKVEKWRSIVIKDEPEDIENKYQVMQEDNLWGCKAQNKQIKNEFSPKQHKIKVEKDVLENRKQKNKKSLESDLSPPQRRRNGIRHDSDSDLSIPSRRKRRKTSQDSDMSLPRSRRKHNASDSDSDMSLPRRRRASNKSNNEKYSNSDSDLSPPRQKKGRSEGSKNSTENRRIQSPVFISKSPPKTKNGDYNSVSHRKNPFKPEIESPRRYDSNAASKNERDRGRYRLPISPSRIKRERRTPCKSPPVRKSRWETQKERERTLSPPPTHKSKDIKTLDGKKAGLQKAQSLKVENEARRHEENRMFEEMSKDISGRDAEIAVRSSGRRGRRAREAQEEDPEERLRREEREQEKKEIYDRWGKGVKQVEDRRTQLEQEAYESSKPLARSRDDADLDKFLREQEHPEDPMLEYMREKKREQMKELNIPVMPKYEGSYPENRYGIRPGYRWDGVDRSNGYENRWFEVRNERKAREEEAYKYSVEDM